MCSKGSCPIVLGETAISVATALRTSKPPAEINALLLLFGVVVSEFIVVIVTAGAEVNVEGVWADWGCVGFWLGSGWVLVDE